MSTTSDPSTRTENKLNALAFELIQTNQDLIELLDQINPQDFEKKASITSRIGRLRSLAFAKKS